MSQAPMLDETSRTAPGFISSRRTPSSSYSIGVFLIRTFTFTHSVVLGYSNRAHRRPFCFPTQLEYPIAPVPECEIRLAWLHRMRLRHAACAQVAAASGR